VIAADGVRTLPDRLRPFWSTFGHLVRNALDHGIESAEERVAAGKPEAGTIALRAWRTDNEDVFEIADDGRGIDWDRVRTRAIASSLPAETHEDLEHALFSDGLSTAAVVSETSGRGVGLAAVQAAVLEIGGRIVVASEPSRGTRFTFTFPSASVRHRRWTIPNQPSTSCA
jgi:chemotaxis protein histidine kinase CheA